MEEKWEKSWRKVVEKWKNLQQKVREKFNELWLASGRFFVTSAIIGFIEKVRQKFNVLVEAENVLTEKISRKVGKKWWIFPRKWGKFDKGSLFCHSVRFE